MKSDKDIYVLAEKTLVPSIDKLVKEFSAYTEKTYGFVVGVEISWLISQKENKNEKAKNGSRSKE